LNDVNVVYWLKLFDLSLSEAGVTPPSIDSCIFLVIEGSCRLLFEVMLESRLW